MAIWKVISRARLKPLCAALLVAAAGVVPYTAQAGNGEVTLIHIGDIHGHLVARPNVRSDAVDGKLEGGVARMYTVVSKLRKEAREHGRDHALVINTGDTLQGSAEALFTRGQAMIDVLNEFGFDAYTPGNWDFLYGTARFEESFIGGNGTPPLAPWNALASNLYHTNQFDDAAVCGMTGTDPSGAVRPLKRVLPTHLIRQVGNVKVGIVGFTTARAIAAVGTSVTANYRFTDGRAELPCLIDKLRNQDKVDLLVMISEMEMARDVALMEANSGVDVVLNSDMHERTTAPIVIQRADGTQSLIVEEGQDGTVVGELELEVKHGKVKEWEWTPHIITSDIKENKRIKRMVDAVRKPFVGKTFVAGQQVTVGGNTTTLMRPVDEVIAYTQVDLHRSNFVQEDMPGVVEGSSHNLIADAMRWAGGTDAASIRGFRYGTHVPAGYGITMADIYHYIPIVSKLGKSTKACGADLKLQVENSTAGVFHPDPTQWQGGWLFGYSNVSFDLDACDGFMGATPTPVGSAPNWGTSRGTNIKVGGELIDINDTYNPATKTCKSGKPGYAVAGYWYADDPTTINNCAPCRGRTIQVVDNNLNTLTLVPGQPLPDSASLLDITEAMVKYLQTPAAQGGLGGVVTAQDLPDHRINVKRLPTINPFPFDMVQPLKGASAATCPVM